MPTPALRIHPLLPPWPCHPRHHPSPALDIPPDGPRHKRQRLEPGQHHGSLGGAGGEPAAGGGGLERQASVASMQGGGASSSQALAGARAGLKIKLKLKGGASLPSPGSGGPPSAGYSPTDGPLSAGPSGRPPLAPAPAASRPKRATKAPARLDGTVLGDEEEEEGQGGGPFEDEAGRAATWGAGALGCCLYSGAAPGSGAPGAQPFSVVVADA